MSGFLFKGFTRLGLAALLANQLILIVCAAQGATITPVFIMISAAVWAWWDGTQTNRHSPITLADKRQILIAGILLAIPMLWVGLTFSVHTLQGSPTSWEWTLNAASLFLTFAACLASGFKHIWAWLATSR